MNDFGKRIANLSNEMPTDAYKVQAPLDLTSFPQNPFEQGSWTKSRLSP